MWMMNWEGCEEKWPRTILAQTTFSCRNSDISQRISVKISNPWAKIKHRTSRLRSRSDQSAVTCGLFCGIGDFSLLSLYTIFLCHINIFCICSKVINIIGRIGDLWGNGARLIRLCIFSALLLFWFFSKPTVTRKEPWTVICYIYICMCVYVLFF
jgi:hypothetical protein